MIDKLWTYRDICEALGVHRGTVWRWTVKLGMPCVRIGDTTRFNPEAVRRWLEEQEREGAITRPDSPPVEVRPASAPLRLVSP